MRFGVLGPLEVRAGGELLTIKGVKERRLLGCLLSRANSVVPAGDIVEALWGADPPRSAAKSVQVYMVRVRKMLGGAAGENALISRQGRGYVLRVARDQVDALEFADLVARAREAAAAGAHGVAATLLRDALGLWRGAAYADFQDTWFGATEAARLEEMRLGALEARIDADLALGRHAEVTAELEALVHECPLRERFWAQLMRALYRSGRQSDALLAFRRARDHLVEEIGVEPGPELQALEAAVLAHDPGLAVAGAAAAAPPELPAELRRADPLFVAREDAMSCLRGLWADAERGRGGLVLVTGPAGIGRTRLAAELAHHAHARGAVVHLRSGPAQADGVLSEPASIVEAAEGRPVLLILDDVGRLGPGPVALLEASAAELPRLSLLVVATYDPAGADSRLHAAELRVGHAHRLALPPLGPADAALIVRRYLGAEAEAGVVGRIVAQAQGLPGRLHELAAAWMEKDAAQRVAGALAQAPAARSALSAVRATVADGVLDLHRVRQARAARAGQAAGDGQTVLCPYKGLARFEKEDAAIFHGREALVAALVARLADTPLVAVTGPSGAGKSSLVRAGLLPALAAGVLPGSGRWQQCVLTPGTAPVGGLAYVPEDLRAVATVVVVDQFEELFTACRDEAERASVVAGLVRLLEREPALVRVIIVIRADYLGACATYPELASRIGEGTVLVGPMSDDEVRRAVEGPARYAGLDVEQDLLDVVVADVRGRPGGLPLLSTALLDTWERRRGRTLTHAGYLAASGVSGALARLAELAYARLAPAGQQAARRILVRLAETGEAGLPVRRRVPLDEVVPQGDEAARAALDVLVARRLVTAGDGNVEVAHEALLAHWPRLARWLEEDEQGRALRRHLAPAARDWARSGRPGAELYRGARLASALDWAAGHTGELNPAEQEFLEASRAAADRELREQRERADREAQARLREARARRRLRAVLACVFALLVFSAVVGAVAFQQRGQARAAQRSAEARRLGALALSEPDLDRSLLLAAAAVRTDPSLATEGDLLSVLLRSPHTLALVRGNGRLQDLALSPDGQALAAGDNDGTVLLWDARTMRRIGTPLHVGDWSGRVAFSPDGRQLAVLSDTGSGSQVVIFDLSSRQVLLRLPAPGNDTGQPTWTRDGRIVAVGSGTGAVIFYDAATGREKGQVNVPGTNTSHAVDAYPAGDKILAIAENTRDAILVDPKTAHIIRRILLPVPASGAGVSRDGRTVAAGDVKGDVVIDDVNTGRVLRRNRAHASLVTNLVFSPDGRTVASLSDDEKVIVWDVRTGKPRLTLEGHTGYIFGGAFAPDGQTLYTDGLDRSVIAWDLTGGRSFATTRPNVDRGPFSVATLGFPYVGWSADRRRAVIAFQTGLVATMDVPTSRPTAQGRPLRDLEDLALSPDGRYAYLTSTDALLRRWDTTTGRVDKVSTVGDNTGKGVVSVSPNGRLLVVCDGSANGGPCYFADARTLQRVGPPIEPGLTAGAATFSPDGRLVALGDYADQGVTVLQVRDGKVRWANRSLSQVQVLGFSPNGRRLVAGTYDGSIATFDAVSGRQLARPVVAQAGPVLAASFAPDGRTILTSATDGTVRLWETAHLRPVGEPLHLLSAQGAFAAFTPDGTEILGMDTTGRVTTWPATTAAWLSRACHIARRDFTPGERTLYSITPATAKPCP